MSTHLIQPEEVERAAKETEKHDAKIERRVSDKSYASRNSENGWNTGHISAYRAAYLKAHQMER